jgi:hypothetical protein
MSIKFRNTLYLCKEIIDYTTYVAIGTLLRVFCRDADSVSEIWTMYFLVGYQCLAPLKTYNLKQTSKSKGKTFIFREYKRHRKGETSYALLPLKKKHANSLILPLHLEPDIPENAQHTNISFIMHRARNCPKALRLFSF